MRVSFVHVADSKGLTLDIAMDDTGSMNIFQSNGGFSRNRNNEALFENAVPGLHQGIQTTTVTEIADDPQLRLKGVSIVNEVDVGGIALFEHLQDLNLAKELIDCVVAVGCILAEVLSIGFDDLDGTDLLSLTVLAVRESVTGHAMRRKRRIRSYHLNTLPYEPFPVSSRNS
jgi:hypothetical protein